MRWKRLLLATVAVFAFAAVLFVAFGPSLFERAANRVLPGMHPEVGAPAQDLHARLFVADLHSDSLLWRRDLLGWSTRGHVDVPRLVEGGVALQVFGVVTRSPVGQNYDHNRTDASDALTAFAIIQLWPPRTWTSLVERALYQADKLRRFAARSGGRLRIIESRGDLSRFVDERRADPGLTAGLLAIEGMHAMEGDLARLDDLRIAGFRMMGITHFFDNQLGGSVHGENKGGLTDLGRAAVRRMEATGVTVDLAHASPQVIRDVLAMAAKPVVVSHTGVRGTCDHVRNLDDEQIRGVAATGGLIGIGYWDAAVCDVSVKGVVRALSHVARLVGADHAALGSDFDGGTETPFDTSGIPRITEGLLAADMPEADVRKIMGENVVRVLQQNLK